MGLIFAWGNFREEDKKREKRENYPHAEISTFTVFVFQIEHAGYHFESFYRGLSISWSQI